MNKTILHEPLPYQAKQMQKDLLIDILRHELSVKDKRIDKAIEYIEKNKKTISKGQAKDTRLQIGTFMWNIDSLLNILRGEENEQ